MAMHLQRPGFESHLRPVEFFARFLHSTIESQCQYLCHVPQLTSPRLSGVACKTNKQKKEQILLHLENEWFYTRSYNWTYKLYKRKSLGVTLSEFLAISYVTGPITNSQIVCGDYCLKKLVSVVKASFMTHTGNLWRSYHQLFSHINSLSILLFVVDLFIILSDLEAF